MEKQRLRIQARLAQVRPRVKLPEDPQVRIAYNVYKPSFESQNFLSEEGRTLYAEAIDSGDENEEEENKFKMKTLHELALVAYAKSYNGGPLFDALPKLDKELFGKKCNIEIPVDKLVELENETFWKRVSEKKCRNRLIYHKINLGQKTMRWKDFGIESKLAELLENTTPENWLDDDYLENTAKVVAPYVEHLQLNQLQPLRDLNNMPEHTSFKIVNPPMTECHHGNLSILRHLTRLAMLQIEFNLQNLVFDYDKRYFEFSYVDCQNLAAALAELKNLKKFRVLRSTMNDKKLKILLNGMEKIALEELDLSYCELDDDCGISLGQYFLINEHLKSLELRGNLIGPLGIEGIACGIKLFKGELYYLGLSQNPILAQGVLSLGGGFLDTKSVKKLDLSLCDLGGYDGGMLAVKIIGFHLILDKYYLSTVPLGPKAGDKIIEALIPNHNLIRLELRGCGLDLEQMVRIRILIDRNNYLRENPCLNKPIIESDDVAGIQAWLGRVKHPLLLKLQEREDSIDSFDLSMRKAHFDHDTISKLISPNQRIIPGDDELLGKNYLDSFGLAEKNVKFQTSDEPDDGGEAIRKHPNDFTEEDFVNTFTIGRNISLQSPHYFDIESISRYK